jgi:hypothetical protein
MNAWERGNAAMGSQVEVERLAAFGPRFLDEGVKLGARTLVIDDFFPTPVTFCKLAQLIKHGTTLGFVQLREFLDDFRCAHGEIIALVGNLSARLIETFPIGTENKGRRHKAAALASAREDSLKGRLVAVVFARRSLEFLVNLAKWLAKLGRQKAGWNPRYDEVERINHRRR